MESVNYQSYLCLDKILSAQQPQTNPPEHDEYLFIIIHQVSELWFQQVLTELDALRITLTNTTNTPKARATMGRIRTIVKTLVSQVDILETMTPLDFNSFRPMLQKASGLQSAQYREIMFSLGERNENVLKRYPEDSQEYKNLARRLSEPSIYSCFLQHLKNCGRSLPQGYPTPPTKTATQSQKELHASLIEIYREEAGLAQLCEQMVDLDEGWQEWRYRHLKMVQRTIGSKMGTGGTGGVEFLQRTMFAPLFPDLWDIRSEL